MASKSGRDADQGLCSRLLRPPGGDVAKTGLFQRFAADIQRPIYQDLPRIMSFDPAETARIERRAYELSVTHADQATHRLRELLPLWVGIGLYALFLVVGSRLLLDPDTMWQVTVGQWILDHRAVPEADVYSFTMRGQPWISTQWLAQVIDGRTELYGEKFFIDHDDASGLMEPDKLFRLLEAYKIEATLMRTQSATTKLLDHIDGWQKIFADDIATIYVRKAGAVHTVEPAVK
jgi:hypothetical protein